MRFIFRLHWSVTFSPHGGGAGCGARRGREEGILLFGGLFRHFDLISPIEDFAQSSIGDCAQHLAPPPGALSNRIPKVGYIEQQEQDGILVLLFHSPGCHRIRLFRPFVPSFRRRFVFPGPCRPPDLLGRRRSDFHVPICRFDQLCARLAISRPARCHAPSGTPRTAPPNEG